MRTPIEHADLEQFDRDGALAETGGELDGATRAAFLRRAGVAAASLAGVGALGGLSGIASAATLPKSDVTILNYALTLEYLEAQFYTEAARSIDRGRFGALAEFAALVRDHENAHVAALKQVLGGKAVKKPSFDFGDAVTDQATFAKTAFTLENTGVSAYLGQAGRIKTPAILAAAASIVTVEARHSAAIALLIDVTNVKGQDGIAPDGAFDRGVSKAKILEAVRGTGFIGG